MRIEREYEAVILRGNLWSVIDQDGNSYIHNISYERARQLADAWNEQEYTDSTGYINPTGLPEGEEL